MSKMNFMKYLPGQINPKINIVPRFMFEFSSVPILTMKSDESFIEDLLHVIAKLVSDFEFKSRL